MLRSWPHAVFTLFLIACGPRPGASGDETAPDSEAVCVEPVAEGCALHRVSLVELLAKPSRWQGRRVAIEGYLHLEREGGGLYPSAEDYQRRNRRRALLTASFMRDVPGPQCKCNDQDVVLVGIYDASDKGQEGAWGGAVKDIEQVQLKQE
jgi:hypothetical protein